MATSAACCPFLRACPAACAISLCSRERKNQARPCSQVSTLPPCPGLGKRMCHTVGKHWEHGLKASCQHSRWPAGRVAPAAGSRQAHNAPEGRQRGVQSHSPCAVGGGYVRCKPPECTPHPSACSAGAAIEEGARAGNSLSNNESPHLLAATSVEYSPRRSVLPLPLPSPLRLSAPPSAHASLMLSSASSAFSVVTTRIVGAALTLSAGSTSSCRHSKYVQSTLIRAEQSRMQCRRHARRLHTTAVTTCRC